jgi:hypothetical protein
MTSLQNQLSLEEQYQTCTAKAAELENRIKTIHNDSAGWVAGLRKDKSIPHKEQLPLLKAHFQPIATTLEQLEIVSHFLSYISLAYFN